MTADYADSAGVANRVAITNETGNTIINAINMADSVIAPWALDPSVLLQTEVVGTTNEIDVVEAGGTLTLSLPLTINADLNGNALTADYADSAGVANRVAITNETGNTIINAINMADSVIAPWALDPSVLLQTEVVGTANEITVVEAGGILTLSLPDTVSASITGNAATADHAVYADSSGNATSIAVTQEMGNTIINAINMADSNIHYWALDETVLLQTEVIGTANEIDVTIIADSVVLSLPATINANINGNAATATTALTAQYADTAGVANSVANTIIAGQSVIDALTTNGDTLTNSTFGTASNVTGVVLEENGGTGISAYTKGDMLFADTTNSLSKLAVGSENQVLYVNNGKPAWGSVPAAGAAPYAIYPSTIDIDSATTYTLAASIVNNSTVVFLSASSLTNPELILPDGVVPGQLLVLMSQIGTQPFHLHDDGGDNVHIANPNHFDFQQHGDNVTLLWCGMEWVEIARTDLN
ncbi:MAG TPA: hypothetical protein VFH43_01825 [Candidatus Kapabacteria bacterium]|nr:hypothetical protein [Candidatus Kapabacteria bacterium]